MESKVHQMIWFRSNKYCFYVWNKFKILIYFKLQKFTPWKLEKLPPQSGKWQFAPVEDHGSNIPYISALWNIMKYLTKVVGLHTERG